jgi:3-oxoacyl-[acyl-carrier-protein] synthase-3
VTVLFGDGAGAMILGPQETDDPKTGIVYTSAHADGTGAMDLYLKIYEIEKAPYIQYDPKNREQNRLLYPQMDGKRVFLNAVRGMVMSTQTALAKTGMTWDDIDWFVPHQANLRINEKVAEVAKIPPEKILNTIQFYGNTTAATVPLTIDHWRKEGKVKKGDRVLSAVFGSGFTWGAAIFTV